MISHIILLETTREYPPCLRTVTERCAQYVTFSVKGSVNSFQFVWHPTLSFIGVLLHIDTTRYNNITFDRAPELMDFVKNSEGQLLHYLLREPEVYE